MNSSNLPNNIKNDRNSWAPSPKKAKEWLGFTPPKPGPMLPRQAILAPAEVTISYPNAEITKAPKMKVSK